MKSKRLLFILVLTIAIISCTKQDEKSQEEESQPLEEQFEDIKKMSESKTCDDGADWKFTAYGHKACGGPVGYIAYSKKIEKEFLKLVDEYTDSQKSFNKKWGTFSTCDVPNKPESVNCVDGMPVLVY